MAAALKTYPAPWKGHIVLACRKCQKKLNPHGKLGALAKLKKTVKRHNKKHSDLLLHVINVPCMDLCPKDGVTVCFPAHDSSRIFIVRNEEDLLQLSCEQ